jgi:hypothetical protein
MQCACALFYCHLWPVRLYSIFPYYLINDRIFEKKRLLSIKLCSFFATLLSENFLILRKTERDMAIEVYWSSRKITLYSCQISINLQFSWQIFENTHISDFMKIHPVGAELFYAEGRTYMTKLIFAFHNIVEAPNSVRCCGLIHPW